MVLVLNILIKPTYLLKNKLFVSSHSVDLFTENRVLFFEENWNLQ